MVNRDVSYTILISDKVNLTISLSAFLHFFLKKNVFKVSLEEIRSKMVRGGDFENNMLTIREMRRRSSLLALDSSEIVSKNRWTINPNSKIAIYWHVVVTCSILYTVVLSPYDLAFGDRVLFVEENKHWIWTVLAVSIDLIFLFDIVVQFRLHRPTSGGYITNPAEVETPTDKKIK